MFVNVILAVLILVTSLLTIIGDNQTSRLKYIKLILITCVTIILFNVIGLESLLDFIATAFILLCVLVGLEVNRSYIFMLILLSIVFMAILQILGIANLAEYFATNVFLLLILAVSKDILHDKIFQN